MALPNSPPAAAPISAPATRLPVPRPPSTAPSAPPAIAPATAPESCRGEFGSFAQPATVAAASAAATILVGNICPSPMKWRDLDGTLRQNSVTCPDRDNDRRESIHLRARQPKLRTQPADRRGAKRQPAAVEVRQLDHDRKTQAGTR